MDLHLLEFEYRVEDRETVETWLSQAGLDGVLLSIEQYNNEMLAVLASNQTLKEARLKLQQHPAISSSTEKQRVVYRVVTTTAPGLVLSSFPFREGEEWYLGAEKTAYLSMQSRLLSN